MIAAWMIYGIIVGVGVSLVAHALERAIEDHPVPKRFIWMLAMAVTTLAPLVVYIAKRPSDSPGIAAGVTVGPATGVAIQSPAQPGVPRRFFDSLAASAELIDRPVLLIWSALSLVLLLRIGRSTAIIWRRRRQWAPKEIDGVTVFVTPDIGPAVIGFPESRIVLPEWVLALDASHVSTVVRHEREHFAAGDARLLVGASALVALFPWNPALWWNLRRLRLAVEMDCDARVLRNGPAVDRYGSLLLAIAQHPRVAMHGAAMLTESTSDLERRIRAMTRKPAFPRFFTLLFGAQAVLLTLLACVIPAPDVVGGPTREESRPGAVAPTPVGTGEALYDFQVEVQARPGRDNKAPMYPRQLRTAGVGGVVVATFVVERDSTPNMETFKVTKSDHDLFTSAVRSALPSWKFVPAQVGGRPVRQLMQMPFVFSPGPVEFVPDSLKPLPAGASPQIREHPAPEVVISETPPRTRVPFTIGRLPVRPAEDTPISPSFAMARVIGDTVAAEASKDNVAPTYPNRLRAANIEGQVVAKFIVRTDGRVDMRTFEVMKSDHDLFTNAVRRAAADLRFKPATINGLEVDWVMTMPFVFSLSKSP